MGAPISPIHCTFFNTDLDCIFEENTVVYDTVFNTFDGEEGPTCGRFCLTFFTLLEMFQVLLVINIQFFK